MNKRRFTVWSLAIAAILPCMARTGDATQSATLATLNTVVHGRILARLYCFDTVIYDLSLSTGGNLNTTPRGTTFIFR